MKLAFLYTESDLTPWKENVNLETLSFLLAQTPINIDAKIIRFEGFNEDMLEELLSFDLVFNLCYGYKDAGQVEVAGWLEHYRIPHTASSYESLKVAQDKSLLPDICGKLDMLTPDVWFCTRNLLDDHLYISKPRKGSCHRNIHINTGAWMKENVDAIKEDLIIQSYIIGREFSVAVIPSQDGKYYAALHPVEIKPENDTDIFIAGKSFGNTHRDFFPDISDHLMEELMESAERLHRCIGLKGMSRTDFRVDKDNQIFTLDVNAMPNMDPVKSLMPAICKNHSIEIPDLINRVIKNSLIFGDVNLLGNKTKIVKC